MTPPTDGLDRFRDMSRAELVGEAQRLHHDLITSRQTSMTWQGVAGRKGGNGAVKTTWLVGVLTMLVMAGGSLYVGTVDSRVASVEAEQKQARDRARDVERKVDVLGEKVQRVEQDTKDIRQEQKEQGKKLDEIRDLLRRAR